MSSTNRLWPAHRKRNLYQSHTASLLADFALEKENIFTQDDDLNVTITQLRRDYLSNCTKTSFQYTDANEILQYIQV
jgi:hypothetical protein